MRGVEYGNFKSSVHKAILSQCCTDTTPNRGLEFFRLLLAIWSGWSRHFGDYLDHFLVTFVRKGNNRLKAL